MQHLSVCSGSVKILVPRFWTISNLNIAAKTLYKTKKTVLNIPLSFYSMKIQNIFTKVTAKKQ